MIVKKKKQLVGDILRMWGNKFIILKARQIQEKKLSIYLVFPITN